MAELLFERIEAEKKENGGLEPAVSFAQNDRAATCSKTGG
jgi:hypothetical protein